MLRTMIESHQSSAKTQNMTSGSTRAGRILCILLPFFAAQIIHSQAAHAPAKPAPIADFTDIAKKAGLTVANVFGGKQSSTYILESTGTGVAIFDYDNDGWPDLVVANYAGFDFAPAPPPGKYPTCLWKGIAVFCGPRGLPASKNILYRNLGNGRFQDLTVPSRIDRTMGHFCFSVTPFDFDNDGWPDIFVACDSTPNILYHNNQDSSFSDVGLFSGVAYNLDGREQSGMGSTVADYDGDGRLDLFRTNFSDDTPTLYHNNGDGTFTDVTYLAGLGSRTQYLGWGTLFCDFDYDVCPDLLIANGHVYPEVDSLDLDIHYSEPKLLYHNNGNGTFTDISDTAGPGIRTPAPSRGLAVGDLWNDGRLSAVIANRSGPPSMLVNRTTYPNHWIEVKAVGTRSNRSGIGAGLLLKTNSREQIDEIRSGSSYISNNDKIG